MELVPSTMISQGVNTLVNVKLPDLRLTPEQHRIIWLQFIRERWTASWTRSSGQKARAARKRTWATEKGTICSRIRRRDTKIRADGKRKQTTRKRTIFSRNIWGSRGAGTKNYQPTGRKDEKQCEWQEREQLAREYEIVTLRRKQDLCAMMERIESFKPAIRGLEEDEDETALLLVDEPAKKYWHKFRKKGERRLLLDRGGGKTRTYWFMFFEAISHDWSNVTMRSTVSSREELTYSPVFSYRRYQCLTSAVLQHSETSND